MGRMYLDSHLEKILPWPFFHSRIQTVHNKSLWLRRLKSEEQEVENAVMLLAGTLRYWGEEKLVVNDIKHFHSHEP
jgi:hypothetical protein